MKRDHIITTIRSDIDYQEKLILSMEKELVTLPEGSIHHKRIRNVSRFYHYDSWDGTRSTGSPKYLGRDNQALKAGLLRKKFIIESLSLLRSNLSAERYFLKKYQPFAPEHVANNLWLNFSITELPIITGWGGTKSQSEWAVEPYDQSRLYPQQLIYCSPNGVRVRSKSESIIAGLLEANNISYKYEAPLHTDDQTYYPDFTVWSAKDEQVLYWEHFGMVDDPEYESAMWKKLASYKAHGIVQWDNLLTTYETNANPFNAQKIQRLIKVFLLID